MDSRLLRFRPAGAAVPPAALLGRREPGERAPLTRPFAAVAALAGERAPAAKGPTWRPRRLRALLRLLPVLALVVAPAPATFAAAAVAPPSLDDVIARHVEAKGGAERLAALTTLEAHGTYTAFSEPGPFTLRRARPAAVRFDYRMLGEAVIDAFDGDSGWSHNPLAGADWPLPLTPAEVPAMTAFAGFDLPLVGYREKGHEVELAGREDFDGIDAWRIEVKRAEGFEETWFLDADTYLEVGWLGPMADFGQPVQGKSFFDDFRPVAGVLLPHRVESEFFIRFRTLEVDEYIANPELPPELFALPPLAGMEALAPLAGKWAVTVQTRAIPRFPWQAAETESTIVARQGGALLDEEIAFVQQGRAVEVLRTWSWDRFRDAYRIAHFDDFSSHLNIFEGAMEDGRLTASNAATGTALLLGEDPVLERYVVHDITADGFEVEHETSSDGGESWTSLLRFTYKRAAG